MTESNGVNLPTVNQLEAGHGTLEESESRKSGGGKWKCLKVTFAIILLLLALVGLILYCLTVLALVCKLVNKNSQPRDMTAANRAVCHIQLRPISYLLQANSAVIFAVNILSAVLLMQSLMLLPLLTARESNELFGNFVWTGGSDSSTMLPVSEREPCHLHVYDFLLRLEYKTRSYDDSIIRVQIPTAPVPLPAGMAQTRTYELLDAKLKDRRLHETAFGPLHDSAAMAYRISVSLMDAGPMEIDTQRQQQQQQRAGSSPQPGWVETLNEEDGERRPSRRRSVL